MGRFINEVCSGSHQCYAKLNYIVCSSKLPASTTSSRSAMSRAGATDVDVGPSSGRKDARLEGTGEDVCFLLASVSGARQSVGKMFDEARQAGV